MSLALLNFGKTGFSVTIETYSSLLIWGYSEKNLIFQNRNETSDVPIWFG